MELEYIWCPCDRVRNRYCVVHSPEDVKYQRPASKTITIDKMEVLSVSSNGYMEKLIEEVKE